MPRRNRTFSRRTRRGPRLKVDFSPLTRVRLPGYIDWMAFSLGIAPSKVIDLSRCISSSTSFRDAQVTESPSDGRVAVQNADLVAFEPVGRKNSADAIAGTRFKVDSSPLIRVR